MLPCFFFQGQEHGEATAAVAPEGPPPARADVSLELRALIPAIDIPLDGRTVKLILPTKQNPDPL